MVKKNVIEEAYVNCSKELSEKKSELLKFIKPMKTDKGYAAYFDESAGEVIAAVEVAEAHVHKVRKDCEHREKLLGVDSLDGLINEVSRMERIISTADRTFRKSVERMIRVHPGMDVRAVENLPECADLATKRDSANEKYTKEIAAMKERIAKVKALEAKYHSS